jgi:hypothetical protein
MFGMWKQDIINSNNELVVLRASFMLLKKLKVGLRAHLSKIARMFETACDKADCDADLQTIFEYCEYRA